MWKQRNKQLTFYRKTPRKKNSFASGNFSFLYRHEDIYT